MLRFLLLRFLPRRLFPILLIIELWRLVRGVRGVRNGTSASAQSKRFYAAAPVTGSTRPD